jgi:hypothetical protein
MKIYIGLGLLFFGLVVTSATPPLGIIAIIIGIIVALLGITESNNHQSQASTTNTPPSKNTTESPKMNLSSTANSSGNRNKVADALSSGVTNIFPNAEAFAALKKDGSVVTWGHPNEGGDSSQVADVLSSGVTKIFSNPGAFAALKKDGSVITWGDPERGGDTNRS